MKKDRPVLQWIRTYSWLQWMDRDGRIRPGGYPIGSIKLVQLMHIYLHEWLIFRVLMYGKYTSPMDPIYIWVLVNAELG